MLYVKLMFHVQKCNVSIYFEDHCLIDKQGTGMNLSKTIPMGKQ